MTRQQTQEVLPSAALIEQLTPQSLYFFVAFVFSQLPAFVCVVPTNEHAKVACFTLDHISTRFLGSPASYRSTAISRSAVLSRRQPVFPAALSLALLYLTVLSFGLLATAYLKWRGMSEAELSLFRGLGAVAGISATLVFPRLHTGFGEPPDSCQPGISSEIRSDGPCNGDKDAMMVGTLCRVM